LLGHELAHVVQQRAGRVRNPLGSGLAVVQDHALEAEADRLGRHAAAHRVAAQPKMPPGATQRSAPVRISPPISAGPDRSYRLTAGAGGQQVGSVMVHARDQGAVEVTDLSVDPAHRQHGIGKMLLASAARTGLQSGKSKVTLAAQDNGSGRLTQWYKGMGFTQIGVNQRGYPQLEAPIGRVIAGAVQRREAQHVKHDPAGPRAAVLQRMDDTAPSSTRERASGTWDNVVCTFETKNTKNRFGNSRYSVTQRAK
jgi:ribosomal protein S18 acetylase RimI-like enzyme